MAGPSPKQRFHYLGVLEVLHMRCKANRKALPGASIQDFAKLRSASFANALDKLRFKVIGRASGKPNDLLKLGAENSRRLERKLLAEIEEATVGKRRDRGIHPQPWPPLLTIQQVTERFVALALGLHAEDRVRAGAIAKLSAVIGASARQTLAPALAWAFLMEATHLHEHDRERMIRRVREDLPAHLQGGRTELTNYPSLAPLLALAKAWHEVLAVDLDLGQSAALQGFGGEIASLLEGDRVLDNQGRIFARLQPTFGWGEAGSARALAVEQARKFGGLSARADTRLTLLAAAHSSHVRPFREDLERRVDPEKLQPRSVTAVGDALKFAGEAYWLSRACFRRTANAGFGILPHAQRRGGTIRSSCDDHQRLDALSTLCLGRLTLALKEESLTDDERLTLHRFRAGFATNPRYWRSEAVISQAEEAVKAYAKLPGSNPALIAHFQARLAWMAAADTQGDPGKERDAVIEGYAESLSKAGVDFLGLDAEAPVHLFPELVHLLELDDQKGKRAQDVLETVDFILSRNFGVYMDMETERAAIVGGMSQAGCIRACADVPGGGLNRISR